MADVPRHRQADRDERFAIHKGAIADIRAFWQADRRERLAVAEGVRPGVLRGRQVTEASL